MTKSVTKYFMNLIYSPDTNIAFFEQAPDKGSTGLSLVVPQAALYFNSLRASIFEQFGFEQPLSGKRSVEAENRQAYEHDEYK